LLKSDERAIGEARPGSDAGNSPGERHAGSDQPASEALAMGVAVRVHTVHAIADVQMPESAAQQKPVADAAAGADHATKHTQATAFREKLTAPWATAFVATDIDRA